MTADTHTADGGIDMEQIAFDNGEVYAEMREAHGKPVYEEDGVAIFRDDHGHELGAIAQCYDGVSRSDLSQWMHETARELYDGDGVGDPWSVADPVIVFRHHEDA